MINDLLSTEWCLRLSQFHRLVVGFSGGIDSTVLLHLLASHQPFKDKLVAVHVNHGINPSAFLWEEHCRHFCQNLGVFFITQSIQLNCSANIEENARIARYSVFSSLMKEHDCLILGQHLDDQAETVLLQLVRGAGIDGLASMAELSHLEVGMLARPLLCASREQLMHYAFLHQLSWVEDESNRDIAYSRNYLRQEIIPLLKKKWPGVVGTIARTATHCQQAKRTLDWLASNDLSHREEGPINHQSIISGNRLPIEVLEQLSQDRMINVLRFWLKQNQVRLPSTRMIYRLVHEIIETSPGGCPKVNWGDISIYRYQKFLYFEKKKNYSLPSYIEWSEFPLPLNLGNSNTNLVAKRAKQGLVIPPNVRIFIRFREGGEKFFWRGQTKRLKKLFQEWAIPPWLRENIPLVYFNNTLVAVVGYAMSDLFFSNDSANAWFFGFEP